MRVHTVPLLVFTSVFVLHVVKCILTFQNGLRKNVNDKASIFLAKPYCGNLSPSSDHSRAAHISPHIISFVKIPRKWGKLEVGPLFVDMKIPPLTINR